MIEWSVDAWDHIRLKDLRSHCVWRMSKCAYAEVVEEGKRGEDGGEDGEGKDGWKTSEELRTLVTGKSAVNGGPFEQGVGRDRGEDMEREIAREFLALLAVCHTVIPEIKDGKTVFQASSPDEAALVAGAELLGYQFHTRKPKSVYVNIQSQSYEYQIINVCEFNSTRKRMSTVIRTPDGKIKLYCKGADTVILERLGKNQLYVEK